MRASLIFGVVVFFAELITGLFSLFTLLEGVTLVLGSFVVLAGALIGDEGGGNIMVTVGVVQLAVWGFFFGGTLGSMLFAYTIFSLGLWLPVFAIAAGIAARQEEEDWPESIKESKAYQT